MPSTGSNPHALAWRKPSRSVNAGACIQAAPLVDGVAVKDSAGNPDSIIRFPGTAWRLFVAGVKA